ncbi:retinal-binding protein [Trichonephila clavata]|uniref:Retinal-binding protein n=1 Tax=Trichonephila clavata TaxID=2740835 RepID=A0A8X6IC39_TRICU|nr:retinal-binding protein [Trichonephila clavata]
MFIFSPVYFNVAYSVLKSILPPVVNEKLRCYGNTGWKAALLELIDADELPAFLGGKKTDPDGDPSCKTFIMHAQPIPDCYFLCNIKKKLDNDPNAVKLNIARSSKEELYIVVEKEGSCLEWEFETKSKDIGFAIYFKENALQNPVEIIPYGRKDTCYGPEKGYIKCKKVGICKYAIGSDIKV